MDFLGGDFLGNLSGFFSSVSTFANEFLSNYLTAEMLAKHLPFVLLGIITGISSGLFGIGGGMIVVPVSVAFSMDAREAVAMSVMQMIFASVFGSWLNYKKGKLDPREGALVGLGGLLGASLSAVVVKNVSDIALTAVFLGVSVIMFFKFFFGVKNPQGASEQNALKKRLVLVGAGALTGVFAISLGIGGGLLLAPILGYFLGYDTKQISRMSLFFIVFASISGSISFFNAGISSPQIILNGVNIGIGAIIGVSIGIKIMETLKLSSHRLALLCVYSFSIIATGVGLVRKIFEI